MKSGRPTGFLDASKAFRVYHCAGTVNPNPRLVADERRPSVSPWRLGGLSPATLARRVYRGVWSHDLLDRAASLSYYFLFALFPALLFLTAILGLLPVPKLMDHLLGYIARVLPADAASLLTKTLGEVIKGARGSLVSLGVLGALWGASSGMVSISNALNVAFEVRDTRTWWRHRLEAIGLTVWFSVLTIAALLLFAFGERIGDAVAQWLGVGAMFTRTWNIARWPALLLFALVGIMLVYQLAPAEESEASRTWAGPGDQSELESETHPSATGATDAAALEEEFDHAPEAEGATDEASALVRKQGVAVGKAQPPSEDEVSEG